MTDLISRLQALTGPSREIDAEIALMNGWQRNFSGHVWMSPQRQLEHEPPRYTESFDAALTLAPEGKRWEVWGAQASRQGPKFRGEIWPVSTTAACVVGYSEATPAIALLIAIMKAKEEAKP